MCAITVEQNAWREALLAEITHYAALCPDRRITSIFFGGGTPSLMPPETVQALLEAIAGHWELDANIEITLEANPTSSEAENFAALAESGINRLSLGVQSLRPGTLSFLGREHSVKKALAAVEMAANHFPRYSFDLIYAHPNQRAAEWENELREALQHANGHLSLYQLTIEPGTAFYHAHARGDLQEIGEDHAAELYQLTQSIMEEAGLPAYEISNHAKPGEESQHNLAYWRYEDYLGIGPGAHGRITLGGKKYATQAIRSPEKWLETVQQQGHGSEAQTLIHPSESAQEYLLMGLRLAEGIDLTNCKTKTGLSAESLLDPQAITRLQNEGLIEKNDSVLRITQKGQLLTNSLIADLIKV